MTDRDREDFMKRLLDFFASLKTAIFLMIVLAVVSIAGTLVPQLQEDSFYIREYGPGIFKAFRLFGLTDLYHSWFFIVLLFLFNVNVVVCFSRRFHSKLKIMKKEKDREISSESLKGMKNSEKFVFSGTVSKSAGLIEKSLKSKRFRTERSDSDKRTVIKASKGFIGQFGSDMVHFSILIITIGALVGSLFGFKDFITMNEGEVKNISRGGFDLRLDRFFIEFYKNTQMPKDYYSTLTVLDNNREALKRTIEVNHPLRYKGIWFYQSSYGQSWDVIKSATFRITDNKNKKSQKVVTFDFKKEFSLPEWDLKLKMADFVSDFIFDTSTKRVFSRSTEHKNPAVLLEVYEKGKLISRPWIFLNFPDAHMSKDDSRFSFQLINYQPVSFSGLQVSKDPGVNIVWAGFFLLTLGLTLTFTVSYKRFWLCLEESGDKISLVLSGNANKNHLSFETEFARTADDLKKILKSS